MCTKAIRHLAGEQFTGFPHAVGKGCTKTNVTNIVRPAAQRIPALCQAALQVVRVPVSVRQVQDGEGSSGTGRGGGGGGRAGGEQGRPGVVGVVGGPGAAE